MSSEEVLEKVKGIIVEQLGVAENAVTIFHFGILLNFFVYFKISL